MILEPNFNLSALQKRGALGFLVQERSLDRYDYFDAFYVNFRWPMSLARYDNYYCLHNSAGIKFDSLRSFVLFLHRCWLGI